MTKPRLVFAVFFVQFLWASFTRAATRAGLRKQRNLKRLKPRVLKRIVLVTSAVFFLGNVAAYEITVGSLPSLESLSTASGQNVSERPGEYLNAYNGLLRWTVVESVLPGPNGMDLKISRSYNHKGNGEWKFDIPELPIAIRSKWLNTSNESKRDDKLVFNGVDNRTWEANILYIPGQQPIRILNGKSVDGSWAVKGCSAGSSSTVCRVLDPNGKIYEFKHIYERNSTKLVEQQVRISDSFGNEINYVQTETGIDISSSDGRSVRVDFQEHGSEYRVTYRGELAQPSRVEILSGTNQGDVWTYSYDYNYYISKSSWCSGEVGDRGENKRECESEYYGGVYGGLSMTGSVGPDGLAISYEYNPWESIGRKAAPPVFLSKVTTDHGLQVAYNYVHQYQSPHRVLSSRTVSDPSEGSISNTTVNYTYGPYPHDRYTIISDPAAKTFIRYGARGTTESGKPTQKKIYAPGADISTASPLRTYEYKYISEGSSSTGFENMWSDKYFKYPALSEVTVDQRYKTVFSNRDTAFKLWKTKTETTGSTSRVTNYVYWNQEGSTTAPRFVGLVDKETLTGGGKSWVTDNTINSSGKITRTVAEGIQSDFTYDSSGNLASYIYNNHLGSLQVSYQNYKAGIPQTETYPDGTQVTRAVNSDGTIAWEQNRAGNRIDFNYDEAGRVTKIAPEGIDATNINYTFATNYAFSAPSGVAGVGRNLITITRNGAPNYKKDIVLDALNRKVLTKEQGAGISAVYQRFDYDDKGYLAFSSLPSSSSSSSIGVEQEFDALGRVIQTKNTGDQSISSNAYRYLSRETAFARAQQECGFVNACYYPLAEELENSLFVDVTDVNAKTTTYQQFNFGTPDSGWPIQITQPESIVTALSHDVLGNLLSVSRGGVTRTYAYESGSQRLKTIDEPERGLVTFTYDNGGNLRTKKVGSAPLTTYSYYSSNRLRTVSYADTTPGVIYEYWGDGSLREMSSGIVRRYYDYTSFGALDNERIVVGDGPGSEVFKLDYDYNSAGFLNKLTYPNGMTLNYGLDDIGRITSVTSPTRTFASNVKYHPNNTLAEMTYGNDVKTTYGLNNRQIVNSINASKGSDAKMKMSFTYDGELNVKSITDQLNTINSVSMTYDGVNRLKTANSALWGNAAFSYDVKGNITSKNMGNLGSLSYNYNASTNRLDSVSGSHSRTFQYDQFGNATTNGVHSMIFNAASRMTQVKDAANGNVLISYAYDGDGIKALEAKQSSALYTIYSQGGDLLFEKDYVSKVETSYVRLGNQTIAKINTACEDKDTDGDGIQDCKEFALGLDPTNAADASADRDGDGLSNKRELELGTNMDNPDTDGDGMDDGWEVAFGLNPNNPVDANEDADGDGQTNYQEYLAGTSPKLAVDSSAILPAILPAILHVILH